MTSKLHNKVIEQPLHYVSQINFSEHYQNIRRHFIFCLQLGQKVNILNFLTLSPKPSILKQSHEFCIFRDHRCTVWFLSPGIQYEQNSCDNVLLQYEPSNIFNMSVIQAWLLNDHKSITNYFQWLLKPYVVYLRFFLT